MAQADGEEGRGFAVPTPIPKKTPYRRLPVRKVNNHNVAARPAVHSSTFEILRHKKDQIPAEADLFCQKFDENHIAAIAQLINLIMEAAGFPPNTINSKGTAGIEPQEIQDEILAYLDQENAYISERYALHTKDKRYVHFRDNYIEFFRCVVAGLEKDFFLKNHHVDLELWLVHLSASKVRCVRHAVTVAAFAACDGLLTIQARNKKNLKRLYTQREVEVESAVVTDLDEQITRTQQSGSCVDKMLANLKHTVFVYRWQDVADVIRREAILSMIRWSEIAPEEFLSNDTYLKEFVYALSDPSETIRQEVIEFLSSTMNTNDGWAFLTKSTIFLRIATEKFVNCLVHDANKFIRINSLRALGRIEQEEGLGDNLVDAVTKNILYSRGDPMEELDLLYALSNFIDHAYFNTTIIRPMDSSEIDQESISTDLRTVLQFIEHINGSANPAIIFRLVLAFWKNAPVLRHVRLLLDFMKFQVGNLTESEEVPARSSLYLLVVLLSVLKILKWETVNESSPDAKEALRSASLSFLTSMPSIVRMLKSDPRCMEISVSCVYEVLTIDEGKVVTQLELPSDLVNALGEILFDQSSLAVIEVVAASLTKLQSCSAESVNKIKSFLEMASEKFKVAYDNWSEELRKPAEDPSQKSFVLNELSVCLKRLAAIVKVSQSNPFYGRWTNLDRLLYICFPCEGEGPCVETYAAEDDRRRQRNNQLLASEMLLAGYLHIWCDIQNSMESLPNLITSSEEEQRGMELSGEDENRTYAAAPTDSQRGEQIETPHRKRQPTTAVFPNSKKVKLPFCSPCSTLGSASEEDRSVLRLVTRTCKLVKLLTALRGQMTRAFVRIVGSETKSSQLNFAKVSAFAGLALLESTAPLEKLWKVIPSFLFKEPCLLDGNKNTDELYDGEQFGMTQEEQWKVLASHIDSLEMRSSFLNRNDLKILFQFYQGLLAYTVSVTTESVPQEVLVQFQKHSGLIPHFESSRMCHLLGFLDRKAEEVPHKAAGLPRFPGIEYVWASTYLSHLLAESRSPFWNSLMASLLLSMLTEEQRPELVVEARNLLNSWKKNAKPEMICDRVYHSIVTICALNLGSLEQFCPVFKKLITPIYMKKNRQRFADLANQCVALAVKQNSKSLELLNLITPLFPKNLVSGKDENDLMKSFEATLKDCPHGKTTSSFIAFCRQVMSSKIPSPKRKSRRRRRRRVVPTASSDEDESDEEEEEEEEEIFFSPES